MRVESDSETVIFSINGTSQKGHSMADGYTLPFLFSGAEQSVFRQM